MGWRGGAVKNIISLGAGVQSTTMALMAAHGEIKPMPDCAIFADTQDEPKSVYTHLEWLKTVLPFPVHVVTNGSLSQRSLTRKTSKGGRRYVSGEVPIWIKDSAGNITPGRRSCTRDFKITPIRRKTKELCGINGRLPKRPVARHWLGISTDEVIRIKPSRVDWIENTWPLIDAGMSRWDCLRWMERNKYPTPPRSACTYCPYHSNAEWLRIKNEDSEAWQAALDFEAQMKAAYRDHDEVLRGEPFLWQFGEELAKADFTMGMSGQADLFGNECEGMCGV